jgi:phosphohistidine swiveling domain-containing protein/ribosomal protein L39E
MNYKTDKRISNIKTSISKEDVDAISKRRWFKVVRRENTPLWESLIQAGGALSDHEIGFDNPMQDLYALDYDKYAAEDSFKTLKDRFIEFCKNDPYFLTKFFSYLEEECKDIDSFIQKNSQNDWSKMSDSEISAIYDQFVNHSLRILTFLWPPLGPEEWIVERISTEISKKIDPVKEFDTHQHALHLLLGSNTPTLIQEREDSIVELASKIVTTDRMSEFKSDIELIYKKYAWINDHSLKFEYESLEHFEEAVKAALQGDPVKTRAKVISEKEKTEIERKELIAKLALPDDVMKYVHQASSLPHWRLLRTEKSVEAAYYLQGMFEEIGKRSGFKDVLLCYYWEVGNLIENKLLDKESVTRRKDGYGLIIMADRIYDLDKESRSIIKKEIESKIELGKLIKGNVACRGFVKGKVRVLHNTKELSTFKEGEVLVTSMTTPEYVPIMKMASAIVTDEGGISCHAAIVSRELKIPCVIGTKNATKVLKTGDEIEVDAEKGIVKILSK